MSSNTKTLRVVVVGNSAQAQKALKGLANEADRTDSQMGRLGGKLGSTFAKIGKSAALGFGVAVTAAAGFTYAVGAPYEQALNKIGALTNKTQEQMQPIAKTLESQAGAFAKFGYSTGDAAGGVVELVKAGQTLDQAMKSLNGTLILAKAGELSVADASSLVANTLNTFKMKADEAGHVANSLANAANASSADVSDLREALAMSALAAKQAGLNIDQTNAYLAILHNNGMKGSDAGTSLKTALLRLTSGSAPVNKALKDIGVSVYDSSGNLRDMQQVIRDFLPALDKLTDQERAQALYDIFGADSIRAANAIFGEGSAKIGAMTAKITEAGTAQRFAQSATQGLSGAIARAKAMSTSFAQSLYRRVSPALAGMMNKALDAASTLRSKFGPALKQAFAGAGGSGAGKQFAKTGASIKQFAAGLAPTLKKIGAGISGALGPGLKKVANIFVNDFLPAFRAFLPAIQPVVKVLLNIFGGAVVGVIKGFVRIVQGVLNMITGAIKVFTGLLKGDWGRVWEGLKQMLGGALNAILGTIQVWWNMGILGLFKQIPKALGGLWRNAWNALKSIASAGLRGLGNVVSGIIRILTAPFRAAFNAVKSYVSTGWNFIRGRFSNGVGGIRAVLGRIVQVITYPYRTAFSALKGIVTGAWNAIKGLFTSGISGVKSALSRIKSVVTGAFSGATGWLKSAGKDVIRGLVAGLDAAKDWVVNKIKAIADLIPGWIKKRLGIASPSKVTKALGKWITIGLAEGIASSQSLKQLQNRLQAVRDRIVKAFKDKKISAATRNGLLDIVNRNEKAMQQVVARRLALAKKLEQAQAKLNASQARIAGLIDAKNQLMDSVRSSAKDHGGFMNTLGSGDESEPNTVVAILHRFKKRLADIASFRTNLAELHKRGLGNALLNQIAQAGPEAGGAMAAALMKASAGQLQDFNSVGFQIDAESNALAASRGSATYDAQIKAAQAESKALRQQITNIKIEIKGNVTAEKELSKAIAKAVRDEIERDNKRNGR